MPFDPNSATLVSEPERGFDPSTARPVSDEPESRYDPSVGMGDYLLNQARKGVRFSANLATAIGQTIDDPDTSFVTTDPVTGKMDRVVSADESAWDGFWRNYERASKLSASVVEANLAMKPPSMTGEVLGGAVEAMADPVNLATGGLLKPTIQAGIAGFGASGGGIAGRTIDPENEYYGETIGTLTGGFAGMGLRLGGEYDMLTKGSVASNIISVSANYTVRDNIDIFARYDMVDDNDDTDKNGKNYLVTGIILACDGGISVAPNLRIVNYENTDKDSETEYKVNFQFKF